MANEKNNIPVWEHQPDETNKQYEAFCVYRNMKIPGDPSSKRSIRQVSEQLGKSETLLNRWSSKNDWVKRADAWDDEQERILSEEQRKQQLADIKKMRKRHADLATAMLVKAAKALKAIPDDEIKPSDMTRMVDIASKLERISRGDVGEVIEERQGEAVGSAVQFYIPDNSRDQEDDFEDL